MQLRSLKKLYVQLLAQKEEDYANDFYHTISERFWRLKKVRKAFERIIGTEEAPKRINPNPYDTPSYWSMKPSEQANVEACFLCDVLTGKINL